MLQLGVLYRVGPGGVRITWRDGSTSSLSHGARLRFAQPPQRIEGRLYRVSDSSRHGYQAPALVPH